jgi:1,4-dihydroxy-2-naphthoate octaprenyltransferase
MEVKKNSFKAWFLAARPKTLTAAATPVFVACALAYHDACFRWQPALICLTFALIAQIVSNFANDYFDYKKGSDTAERMGPRRAVAEGWIAPKTMLYVTTGLLAIDLIIGLFLLYYGGWILLITGAFIALVALAYSGGPYPLAYHGWGDVCVFIFFGIVPVGFTYYLQALHWSLSATICGIAVGLVVINILVANNYRDRDSDTKTNKKTTIVLFGETFGRYFYLFNGLVAVLCCQYFWMCEMDLAAILPLFYLFAHIATWQKMNSLEQGSQSIQAQELIIILEKSARNALIFGILLSIGMIF